MTTSPEHVAAEALVARIEELLPKVTEQWQRTVCDDGRTLICTPGDIVCHPDPNHQPPDQWDMDNFAYIEAVQPENVKVLLSALRRQSPASQANAVNALEWKKDRGSVAWATSILGTYYVNPSEDHPGKFYAYNSGHLLFDSGYQDDEDAAKAFAQADYERRVLSALTASPSPAGAVAPAAGVPDFPRALQRALIKAIMDEYGGSEETALEAISDALDDAYPAALQPAPHPDTDGGGGGNEPDFATSIAELIREESGGGAACGWKSCSGCHETNEGQETGHYDYSPMFGCHVGSGCTECGGLGVVWEYWSEAEIAAMLEETHPDTDSGGGADDFDKDFAAVERSINQGVRRSTTRFALHPQPSAVEDPHVHPAPQAPDAQGGVDDWTVDDTLTAREVLNYLGIGSDASLEPFADRRRDRVAKIIQGRVSAALGSALQPAGVDGWRLVPVEPTDDMIEAYFDAHYAAGDEVLAGASEIWRAMLAAAPLPSPSASHTAPQGGE